MENEDLFFLKLDGKDEQFQIALVLNPAIKDDWRKFNDQNFQFKVTDSTKRILSGYAMIADLKIPRVNKDGEQFMVTFTKESIREIVYNFFRNSLVKNFNENHQTGQLAEGVFLFESLFIDSTRGINCPEGFSQVADGSWFISIKVENEDVWKKVEANEYKGFSVESREFTEDKFSELDSFLTSLKVTKEK